MSKCNYAINLYGKVKIRNDLPMDHYKDVTKQDECSVNLYRTPCNELGFSIKETKLELDMNSEIEYFKKKISEAHGIPFEYLKSNFYDSLLAANSNYVPVQHHSWNTDGWSSNVTNTNNLIPSSKSIRVIPIDLYCFEIDPKTLEPITEPVRDNYAVSKPTHAMQIPVNKWVEMKRKLKEKISND